MVSKAEKAADKRAADAKADAEAAAGQSHEPTKAENEKAMNRAEELGDEFNKAKSEGNFEAGYQAHEKAMREGASVLGKDKVVVQGPNGQPMTATRGLGDQPEQSSATNAALMANDVKADGKPNPAYPKGEARMHGGTGARVNG